MRDDFDLNKPFWDHMLLNGYVVRDTDRNIFFKRHPEGVKEREWNKQLRECAELFRKEHGKCKYDCVLPGTVHHLKFKTHCPSCEEEFTVSSSSEYKEDALIDGARTHIFGGLFHIECPKCATFGATINFTHGKCCGTRQRRIEDDNA